MNNISRIATDLAWTIDAIDDVVNRLRRYRFRFGTEALLQEDVAAALCREKIPFIAECQLDKHDRPDFYLLRLQISIECKIDGGPSAVWEQLARYTQHDDVAGLILVSRRRAHHPQATEIGGKPFRYVWIAANL